MRYLFLVAVMLAATTCQAEPFTAWELAGSIWARDEATGYEWQLSRGSNCHSPDVDGGLAVWIADWSYSADVMGYHLPAGGVDWAVAVQSAVASEPQVSHLALPDEWAYVVWRQEGGIWGRRLRDFAPDPVEVVPDYGGPFTLEGRTLTWDDGSMELSFPSPQIPEPQAGIMLLLAVGTGLCLLGRHQ